MCASHKPGALRLLSLLSSNEPARKSVPSVAATDALHSSLLLRSAQVNLTVVL